MTTTNRGTKSAKGSKTLVWARWLANASAQDMRSDLYQYGSADLRVLQIALVICKNRGEKTKAKILERKIKKVRG